ncbi:MAG: YvcK family protein [Firmicutes bacterium]|jgi:uncharacterized cofD-like protein|nr:YvcK family protein [Bacillota bacterium]
MGCWKWLYPGMGVKRWLLLVVLGVLLFSGGVVLLADVHSVALIRILIAGWFYRLTGLIPSELVNWAAMGCILLGSFFICFGIRQTINSLISVLMPRPTPSLVDLVYSKRQLGRGPKIVAFGGGTGLSTLLRGLKEFSGNLTAVVTVADDGGSSGRLRSQLGIPAPGDIRNTLVALADTEPLMEKLFQYRFAEGEELKGHSFGNLFIAAMTAVLGDFQEAVRQSSRVLFIRGQVLPSTLASVVLRASYNDGSTVTGESKIPSPGKRIERLYLDPPSPPAVKETLDAIAEADIIVLGPGSLYTSVLPNLLVAGVVDALRASTAVRIYVCNVMTQPGETDGYTAADHLQAVLDHAGEKIVDYVLVNSQRAPARLIKRYREEGAHQVQIDGHRLQSMGVQVVKRALMEESDLARHDPQKLAQAVIEIWLQHRGNSQRSLVAGIE